MPELGLAIMSACLLVVRPLFVQMFGKLSSDPEIPLLKMQQQDSSQDLTGSYPGWCRASLHKSGPGNLDIERRAQFGNGPAKTDVERQIQNGRGKHGTENVARFVLEYFFETDS